MIAETTQTETETETETANCHQCHGTGSGVYNALSAESTCEACGGTGMARPASAPKTPHSGMGPRS